MTEMDMKEFDKFCEGCIRQLPHEIDKILNAAKGKKLCSIGFVTTDDFYGFYLTWDYNNQIDKYYDWTNSLEADFLYQPLVDIVDNCSIDLLNPSDEKWAFAQALLAVLEQSIRQIPDEIFRKNGFERGDVLFFATMSTGDYVQQMMDASVKMFNTIKAETSMEKQ